MIKDRTEDAIKKGIKLSSTYQLPLVRIPTVTSDFNDTKSGACQPDTKFSTPVKPSRLINTDYTQCDSEVSRKSSGRIHPFSAFDSPMQESNFEPNQNTA